MNGLLLTLLFATGLYQVVFEPLARYLHGVWRKRHGECPHYTTGWWCERGTQPHQAHVRVNMSRADADETAALVKKIGEMPW